VLAQLVQRGDERAVRLAEAERAKLAEQQIHAVADLRLGDPHHAPGAPVRQPVQQHGGVQADLQRQWRGAAKPGRARRDQGGETAGQPGQHVAGSDERGQYDTGERTSRRA
jgi:hypothetical protein